MRFAAGARGISLVVAVLTTSGLVGIAHAAPAAGAGPDAAGALAAAAAPANLTEVGAPFASRSMTPFGGPLLDANATGRLWSSAAVAEVTGDGSPDIVVGGGLGSALSVYSTSGAERRVDVGGVDTAARRGGVQPSPAITELNGDGVADVLTGTTANVLAAYSFRGGSGSQLWRRQDPPIVPDGPTGFLATPAVGFLSGDAPSVVTASWGQALGANNAVSGSPLPGWPQWLRDSIWSSPAIGDIDGDGANEVVSGGDCAGNDIGTQPCGSVGGGYVWAFNRDGAEKWRWFLRGQVIWSSPALGDLNGDGALDVVVGSGGYWAEPAGRVLTALNGRNGAVLWQAATPARVVGSPSLADVTGDGRPDVFVVSYGGYLLSFDGASGRQRWSACLTDGGDCGDVGIGTMSGLALADIDGDGAIEAVTQGEQQLRVYDAGSGALEWRRKSAYSGTILAPANAPTIASVNGEAWIVQPVHGFRTVNGARVDELVATVWRSGTGLGTAPWPTARANLQRTGAVATSGPDRAAVESFVTRLHQDFLDRAPTSGELQAWSDRLQRGQVSRYDVATELSRSDEWISTVITRFYRDTLGREPDAGGLAGWVRAARDGMPIAQIAAGFYASPEYFATIGRSDNETWVRDLYRKLLLREGDAGGVAGWVRSLQAGTPRDQVATGFYQSAESLAVRIDRLYQDLLGRRAEPGGIASWSPLVRDNGDLVLAAALASSEEYYARR